MPHGIQTKRLTPPRARLLDRRSAPERRAGGRRLRGLLEPRRRTPLLRKERLAGKARRRRCFARKPVEPPAGDDRLRQVHARPTACPTSRTRTGAAGSRCVADSIPNRPRSTAARAKCRQLLPPGPGSGPPPSRQTLAKFLKIARCMRQHGVSDFPDPRTSAPPNPLGPASRELSDIEGVILLFPSTINQQSPVFTRAAAACAFPLHNH